jgi:uncharacterized membrane protein
MRYILLWNMLWMGWNVTLALVPLALSFVLFRVRSARRSVLWWVGVFIFLAYLPNAPYVLTDVVHLTGDMSAAAATGTDTGINAVIAQYALLFAIGFGAYAWSVWNLAHYLVHVARWRLAWVACAELVVHALCTVGVLLGRFGRFNSWQIATEPSGVARYVRGALDDPVSWKLAAFTFFVLATGTAVLHAFVWGMTLAGRSLVRLDRA